MIMPFNKIVAAGLFALSALIVAAPAQAHSTGSPQTGFTIQFGTTGPAQFRGQHGRWGVLSPRQVQWALQRQGYRNVRITGSHGPVYRAIAVSPRGSRVALTVSARNARVINVSHIGPRHRWGRGGRGYY
jgi:hypothetical protein